MNGEIRTDLEGVSREWVIPNQLRDYGKQLDY